MGPFKQCKMMMVMMGEREGMHSNIAGTAHHFHHVGRPVRHLFSHTRDVFKRGGAVLNELIKGRHERTQRQLFERP